MFKKSLCILSLFVVVLFAAGCGGGSSTPSGGGKEMQKGEGMNSGAGTQIAQKTCPVMGGKIDPSVFIDYKGRRIYFCCPGCEEKFQKDPEKYLKIVDAELAKN